MESSGQQKDDINALRARLLATLEGKFDPVTLDDQDDSLFKQRFETKYLFSPDLLVKLLERLAGNYRVLSIDDRLIQDYQSLYFDNSEFKFYLDHQNGKLNRHKVRFRKYPGREQTYVEVKFKNNKNQTKKWREKISLSKYSGGTLTDRETHFIKPLFNSLPGKLFPRFTVSYARMTLVHKKHNERVTIDFDLSYFMDKKKKQFKCIAVAEVKQGRLSAYSDFFKVMRSFRISPVRFSKYCFGVNQYFPVLKHNSFKSRHLFLNRYCNEKELM
jgi:hypothetical protein